MSCQALLVFLDALGRPKTKIGFLSYDLSPSIQFSGHENLSFESFDFSVRKNGSMNACSYIDSDHEHAHNQQEPLQSSLPSPHDSFPVTRPKSQLLACRWFLDGSPRNNRSARSATSLAAVDNSSTSW